MASNCNPPSIKLNVGGRIFETTLPTLQAGGRDSLFYALSNRSLTEPNPVFIDRDPEIFSVILSLLRTSRLPSTALRRFSAQDLADEALYYGVEPILRSALAPIPLSGIDASVSTTIFTAVDGFASTFAAADDGSVWIAHGGQISSYDWNLSHVGTIRTHFDEVTSIVRLWPEIAAVGSASAAGLHFYDFSGGRHVGSIHWTDPTDPRIYKARVMALGSSPSSVFTSLECPHKENSVFEIDKSTLNIVAQFGRQSGSSTKNMAAGKLIWLPERNIVCGTAVSFGAFGYSGYIRLWDPRCSGEVIWEIVEPGSGRSSRFGDSFADADVDVEESVLFKVCSKSGDLGMADLRKLGDDPWVYLKDTNPTMRSTDISSSVIHCYRKQVFVGKEGSLEVWSRVKNVEFGPGGERDWDYRMNFVDKVEDSKRGVIKKIEGGGDRLFVGRDDAEGIEVWESSNVAVADSIL